MKKTFAMILAFITGLSVFAQSSRKTTISGTIPELANGKLILSYLGKPKGEALVTENGNFSYTSTTLKAGFYQTNLNYSLYLEPGMDLKVIKTKKGLDLEGKGSNENNLIKEIQNLQWKMLFVKAYQLSDTANFIEPAVYLEKISWYKQAVNELISKASVSKDFSSLIIPIADYDCKYFLSQYKIHYGTDPVKQDSATKFLARALKERKPTDGIPAEVMKQYSDLRAAARVKRLNSEDAEKLEVLEKLDLNDGKMYAASVSYRRLLDERLGQLAGAEVIVSPSLRKKDPVEIKLMVVNKFITDPIVKESLLFDAITRLLRPGKDLESLYQTYLASAKDQEYISEVKKQYTQLLALNAGSASPKFQYKDVNGQPVSSESFKGSYVYIDFWATWCGPCLAEIPAYKELQKAYEGKNIKFLSISTDAPKDLDKWKNMVAEMDLPGTQLIVDKDSEFYKFYRVATIPRFILLDKDGKIVDANAKRPSNPRLREELDKLVN